MSIGAEQDFQGMRRDWERVGGYLSAAIQEVSLELGGEELAVRIGEAAISDEVLPNPAALKLLEELHPGSLERVLTRSTEIQTETHERELAELKQPSVKKYGQALLKGFASISNFGIQRRKSH